MGTTNVSKSRVVRAVAPFLLLLGVSATLWFAQATADVPTKQEMAQAYRSILIGSPFPGRRAEIRPMNEIRGWKIAFQAHKREAITRPLDYPIQCDGEEEQLVRRISDHGHRVHKPADQT